MKPKVIKTEADYQEALAYLDTLMDSEPSSAEEQELELFGMLVEAYEKEHFPIGLPDPVEAIKFRMEQQGLTRKDLAPYIGSQSKVSEVLNRKRPLSLSMIRALHSGLGIPAEVLLQNPGQEMPEQRYDVSRFPFTEMFSAGYFASFQGNLQEAKRMAEELLEGLFAALHGPYEMKILCRAAGQEINEHALRAWQARVLQIAAGLDLAPFERGSFTIPFLRSVINLSYLDQGPRLAQEMLHKRGIPLVFLAHLPHTNLDGACIGTPAGRPVIGLTLRYDRHDNFWFTLAHELSHSYLHLDNRAIAFFDDTENDNTQDENAQEIEGNAFARDLLIPDEIWSSEKAHLVNASREEVILFANRLLVSPAIIAGRIRWERKDFTRFAHLVNQPSIRKLVASTAA